MTAEEIHVGARFTLSGEETVYTVEYQTPGRSPYAHLTTARFEEDKYRTFAGHTDVIAHPQTEAKQTQYQ